MSKKVAPQRWWAWGDSLDQSYVDAAAGFGDSLSFGLTNGIRNLTGSNGAVNKCSAGFRNGQLGGVGLSLAFGGAHLGRAALNQTAKGGISQGLSRVITDSRAWSSVQRTWSKNVGG